MSSLQSLNLRHFMIAHLLAQGRSQAETARKLKISTSLIQNCLDSSEFQLALSDLKKEYEEKLSESVILPFAEMQKKVNEEALGALSRVVAISHADRANATVLNANLALLDRASNMPKASKLDPGEAPKDLFSVSVVQLVLQTALEVGDKTVLKAAEKALKQIPAEMTPHEALEVEYRVQEQHSELHMESNASAFSLKPVDQVANGLSDEEYEEDNEYED